MKNLINNIFRFVRPELWASVRSAMPYVLSFIVLPVICPAQSESKPLPDTLSQTIAQPVAVVNPVPVSGATAYDLKLTRAGKMICAAALDAGLKCPGHPVAKTVWEERASAPRPRLILSADTPVKVRLLDTVRSSEVKAGDGVDLVVIEDVIADGRVVIQKGSHAWAIADVGTKRQKYCGGDVLVLTVAGVHSITGETVELNGTSGSEGGSCLSGNVGDLIVLAFGNWMHGDSVVVPKGTNLVGYVRTETEFDEATVDTLLERVTLAQDQVRKGLGGALVHIYRSDFDLQGRERDQVPVALGSNMPNGMVRLSDPELKKTYTVEQAQARMYRPIGGGRIKVYLDEQLIGELKDDATMAVKVAPGKHVLSTKESAWAVTLEEGEQYYMRVHNHAGFIHHGKDYAEFVTNDDGELATSVLDQMDTRDLTLPVQGPSPSYALMGKYEPKWVSKPILKW